MKRGTRVTDRLDSRAINLFDEAIARLDEYAGDPERTVHDVRRRLKEIRALLRLIQPALPDDGGRQRKVVRDVARRLAGARDARATIDAFDRLRKQLGRRRFPAVRALLLSRARSDFTPQDAVAMRETLRAERERAADWRLEPINRSDLWRAIGQGYRAARRAMAVAVAGREAAQFHDWRKRVKVHWHQARIFDDMGIGSLAERAEELRTLSRLLGEHHDLTLIDEILGQSPPESPSSQSSIFCQEIHERLAILEREAQAAGRKLFGERASEWVSGARMASLDLVAEQTIDLTRRRGPKRSPRRREDRSQVSA